MPVAIPISTWLTYAEISQYLQASKNSTQKIFNGSSVTPDYTSLLYIVRTLIQAQYNRDPTDESLNDTGLYMRALIDEATAALVVANAGCIAPTITTNPVTQSGTAGGNITFTVVASGTSLTYQWKKDGVNISLATSSSYTITGTVTGDSGVYSCVVSNGCGTATSTGATLTISAAALNFTIGWSASDPFVNTSTALTITNSQTVSFASGANLIFTGSLAAFANNFIMWSFPVGETSPNLWSNGDPSTAINQGPIPDATMRDTWTVSGVKYICSRIPMTLDTTKDLRLCH